MNIIIRKEIESDIESITEITKAAFENHPYSHNTEHFIIKVLREAKALTLSLVAEVENKVGGHIAFSPVDISDGSPGWYGLGPISVLPELQRQGIGKSLVHEGLSMLKVLGQEVACLWAIPPTINGSASGISRSWFLRAFHNSTFLPCHSRKPRPGAR